MFLYASFHWQLYISYSYFPQKTWSFIKIRLLKEDFSAKKRAIGPTMRIFPTIARLICLGEWQVCGRYAQPRTTDTQWMHKSKISEKLGRCGRQNMLRPYLKIWEWEWIFGRSVKAISFLGVRVYIFINKSKPWINRCKKTTRIMRNVLPKLQKSL